MMRYNSNIWYMSFVSSDTLLTFCSFWNDKQDKKSYNSSTYASYIHAYVYISKQCPLTFCTFSIRIMHYLFNAMFIVFVMYLVIWIICLIFCTPFQVSYDMICDVLENDMRYGIRYNNFVLRNPIQLNSNQTKYIKTPFISKPKSPFPQHQTEL